MSFASFCHSRAVYLDYKMPNQINVKVYIMHVLGIRLFLIKNTNHSYSFMSIDWIITVEPRYKEVGYNKTLL